MSISRCAERISIDVRPLWFVVMVSGYNGCRPISVNPLLRPSSVVVLSDGYVFCRSAIVWISAVEQKGEMQVHINRAILYMNATW